MYTFWFTGLGSVITYIGALPSSNFESIMGNNFLLGLCGGLNDWLGELAAVLVGVACCGGFVGVDGCCTGVGVGVVGLVGVGVVDLVGVVGVVL